MAKKIHPDEQVALFLEQLQHPLKAEILLVRAQIRSNFPELTEHIKWNAPSFCYNGDDRITFNLAGKGLFRIVFHLGATSKSSKTGKRLFEDASGLLEWAADDRAILSYRHPEDVQTLAVPLQQIITNWLAAENT